MALQGRPRLEDAEGSDWLERTEKAIRLKHDYPSMTWKQVARRFNMSEKTLQRHRRKLHQPS